MKTMRSARRVLSVFCMAFAVTIFSQMNSFAVSASEIEAGSEISTAVANKPIVGFVFGQKGLMYDLSLNGAKVTKIQR
jgi:lipid-binding SYLF domain-containing protein